MIVQMVLEKSTTGTVTGESGFVGIIIAVLAIVAAPFFGYLAARQANKQASKKAQVEAEGINKQADTDGWDTLVKALQGEVKRISDRLEGLEKQGVADRKRIDELEEKVRLGDVKYRVALQYIHDIIAWTKQIFNSDQVPPAAPPLIASDLEMH